MGALVVYGTTEGRTRKIAEWMAGRIRELGHEPQLHDSSALAGDVRMGAFAAIIIAASVRQKLHQEAVTAFAMAHRDELKA